MRANFKVTKLKDKVSARTRSVTVHLHTFAEPIWWLQFDYNLTLVL